MVYLNFYVVKTTVVLIIEYIFKLFKNNFRYIIFNEDKYN